MIRKQKIFVGVSGGVDSSVVAYLLKKEGHDVHGVFIKTWSPEWLPCTWVEEKRDAMRVCASLDIPFHFLDAEDAYKKGVADYMIAEYRAGRTPNPDVLCNRIIKFGVLWEYAKAKSADAIATGHYAQIEKGQLKKGKDTTKDQSYFLWMLKSDELDHLQFPIGHFAKREVRAIAQKANLFTASKKDSQGICFLGDIDMREFLSHYIDVQKGTVVDTNGRIIGEHDGVLLYTVGSRHGFRITPQSNFSKPLYIVDKNIAQNILIVSEKPQTLIFDQTNKKTFQQITLRDTNWIRNFDTEKTYTANVRYHGSLVPVRIEHDTLVSIEYDGVVALGQSLVVYDDDVLVGGGIIQRIS